MQSTGQDNGQFSRLRYLRMKLKEKGLVILLPRISKHRFPIWNSGFSKTKSTLFE
jgi:hypothetical protein